MTNDQEKLLVNKAVVRRFNQEVIERGKKDAFDALMSSDFVNRTAPPGAPSGPEGMWHFFENVLRPALPDLTVEIHDQIAEGDLVTTRKTIRGTHKGALFGIPATNQSVEIQVYDIVRVKDGRYVEHWGLNTLGAVLAELGKG
jgi:predicted ester cyclase